jgi:hypothetical protein
MIIAHKKDITYPRINTATGTGYVYDEANEICFFKQRGVFSEIKVNSREEAQELMAELDRLHNVKFLTNDDIEA